MSEMPEIAWLSLKVRSSKAEIIVHERIDKPDIVNEKSPCDIIASKSGVIRKMSVLEGESAAIVGNAVAKGDVLVRGLMSSETGDERYVHSMAQVIAKRRCLKSEKPKRAAETRPFRLLSGKSG